MARIRSIKPEFAHDELLGSMPRDARLLFVLLWPLADDEGRFRAHPSLVRSECFPYDDDVDNAAVEKWLGLLDKAGRIALYEHAGQRYGVVLNFIKHQRISKPTPSRLPAPPMDVWPAGIKPEPNTPQGIPGNPRASRVGLDMEWNGREGKGSGTEGGAGETKTPRTAGAFGAPAAAGARTERDPEVAAAEARLRAALAAKGITAVPSDGRPATGQTAGPLPAPAALAARLAPTTHEGKDRHSDDPGKPEGQSKDTA
jgi:hypothetical protein